MNPGDVIEKTHDITDSLVGVFLGGEIRVAYTRWHQWQAYLVTYNSKQNINAVRVLRIKKGKDAGEPVKTMFHYEGIGDLIDLIHNLNALGKL